MTQDYLPKHPFWTFSLNVYAKPNVKHACLDLQERHDLNVNILLLCCWFAQSGRGRFDLSDIRLVVLSIQQWHEGITVGMRNMRKQLTELGVADWAKKLRKSVSETELYAEKIEQLFLADIIKRRSIRERSILQQVTDALSSLSTYGKFKQVQYTHADLHAIYELLAGVFGQIPKQELANLCKTLLM